ncbi:MAG: amino acid carrier protein [Elusimicrobiota bacterium]|jgi:AGCS family alanine or glycine:cation symporter|nr:amino acid carrier protein [Elusimicrobiota bacterium]
MDEIKIIIDKTNEFLWGFPLIVLLVVTHIYLTFKLKFIQKYIFKAIKLSVKKDDSAGNVSNFAALSISLAATLGTGSIVGMATAVAVGGPGAVFWMLVVGFFGVATKYAECVLSIKYRVKNENNEYAGGPMYIMKNVLKQKWFAYIFAFIGLCVAVIAGGMLQVNTIADVLGDAYGTNSYLVGVVVAVLVGVVILGGLKNIAKACEFLVPIMGVVYLIAALIILAMHIEAVPAVAALIVKSAFSGKAAFGGFAGVAIMKAVFMGTSRSVFSTEAGLGSAGIAAAAAKTENPVRQGLIASTSVFWAMLVCTLTGFIILLAGDWHSGAKFAGDLCNSAFATIPYAGVVILVVSLVVFSFTTIIGWAYYGEKFIEFLGGGKVIIPFRILWLGFMFLGAVAASRLVWSLVELFIALFAIPNLIMIFILRKDIFKETDKYLEKEIKNI